MRYLIEIKIYFSKTKPAINGASTWIKGQQRPKAEIKRKIRISERSIRTLTYRPFTT